MSKIWSLIFVVTISLSSSLQAKSGSTIMRGGLGFLFPDANSFQNPGQLSLNKGFSVQAAYLQQDVSGTTFMVAQPSAVYSSGTLALGGYATRIGTSFSDATSYATVAGGAMGVALAKGKVTVGGSFDKYLDVTPAPNDGTVAATFTVNGGSKGMGPVFGGKVGMALNAVPDSKFAAGGVGYGFKNNTSVEANVAANDITALDDLNLGGFFSWAGSSVYMSGGFTYAKLTAASAAAGRIGFILGGKVDFSGAITYPFQSGTNPTFGGSLRATF